MRIWSGLTPAFKAWCRSVPLAVIVPVGICWIVAATFSVIAGEGISSILSLLWGPFLWVVAVLQVDIYFIIGLPIFYGAFSRSQCVIWRRAPGMLVGIALGAVVGMFLLWAAAGGTKEFLAWYPLVIGAMYGGATAFAALTVRPRQPDKQH